MLHKKQSLLFSLLLAMIALLSACGGGAAPAQPDNTGSALDPSPAATLPAVEPTPELAALVNGQPITRVAFQRELEREEARWADVGAVPADRTAFEGTVLNNMIDQQLIEQAALLQGLEVTDAEIDTEIALNVELAGGQDAFDAWLAENIFTAEEYRVSMHSALLTAKIRDQVISVVPDAVEQVHARHILVSTEAEAQDIYQQLAGGADFAEMAGTHSRDVITRELGGDLGWFAREELTVPEVADIAFSLEPGTISEPVASALGFHIVQPLEHVDNRPLDDAVRAQFYEATFERWRQSLWDQADILRFIGG